MGHGSLAESSLPALCTSSPGSVSPDGATEGQWSHTSSYNGLSGENTHLVVYVACAKSFGFIVQTFVTIVTSL